MKQIALVLCALLLCTNVSFALDKIIFKIEEVKNKYNVISIKLVIFSNFINFY